MKALWEILEECLAVCQDEIAGLYDNEAEEVEALVQWLKDNDVTEVDVLEERRVNALHY